MHQIAYPTIAIGTTINGNRISHHQLKQIISLSPSLCAPVGA